VSSERSLSQKERRVPEVLVLLRNAVVADDQEATGPPRAMSDHREQAHSLGVLQNRRLDRPEWKEHPAADQQDDHAPTDPGRVVGVELGDLGRRQRASIDAHIIDGAVKVVAISGG